MIDRRRGSDALQRFFTESFRGVLIHDFWAPYESVLLEGAGEHQCCLAHLLREVDEVDEHGLPRKSSDAARAWMAFSKMLKRLVRDAIRLRRREDFDPQRHASRIRCIHPIHERLGLVALGEADHADADAKRLAKRLERYRDSLFTFLDRPEADWTNNFAERHIRPAVILRRTRRCNRSEKGAATQAVLMSVYRALTLRGHDPRQAIEEALRTYCGTGTLPPLPDPVATRNSTPSARLGPQIGPGCDARRSGCCARLNRYARASRNSAGPRAEQNADVRAVHKAVVIQIFQAT